MDCGCGICDDDCVFLNSLVRLRQRAVVLDYRVNDAALDVNVNIRRHRVTVGSCGLVENVVAVLDVAVVRGRDSVLLFSGCPLVNY